MYSYKVTEPQGQRDIANANADSQEADAANENAEIVEVMNDVEVLLGDHRYHQLNNLGDKKNGGFLKPFF